MNLINKISTKKLVGINLFLFVSSSVIVLINIIINYIAMEKILNSSNIASIGVGAFFRLCIVLGLAIEAYKGKNWARWGVVILSLISALINLQIFRLLDITLCNFLLFIINVIVVLSMSISKKVSTYYKKKTY